MALISIHVGSQNESRLTADINEDGTMLTVTSEYNLNVLDEPHPFERAQVSFHADSPEELLAFIETVAATLPAHADVVARQMQSDTAPLEVAQ